MLLVKNSTANAGDLRPGFNPWVGKIPWRREWQPIHYCCLENPHGQTSLMGYKSIGSQRFEYDWSHLACMHIWKVFWNLDSSKDLRLLLLFQVWPFISWLNPWIQRPDIFIFNTLLPKQYWPCGPLIFIERTFSIILINNVFYAVGEASFWNLKFEKHKLIIDTDRRWTHHLNYHIYEYIVLAS